ncbi:MAG: aspartate kinase [Candidatus Bathyarchaeia archaeon]
MVELGGSSIADPGRLSNASRIITDRVASGDRIVVVVSALPGVTDRLLEVAEQACAGDQNHVKDTVEDIRNLHLGFVDACIGEDFREDSIHSLRFLCEDLNRILIGISYLRELTARSRDYVLAFGERLSTTIVYYLLRSKGLEAEYFLGGECGIITDMNHGDASPLYNVCRVEVRRILGPLLDAGIIPVVTGFIGKTQEGVVTTLGRGGSDYTATLIGAALKADEVWILGEVEGLMTADPRIEPKARVIRRLSYDEAMEMAHFRAKSIHPRALEPAALTGIPVKIRSILSWDDPGTLISGEGGRPMVKAVTMIDDAAMITVSGGGMMGAPGTAAKVFRILGEHGINILMISQSSSEVNISMVVPEEDLDKAVSALEMAILGKENIREIKPEPSISVISVIGGGMKGTIGIAAKVFGAVAENNVNVKMIAQGSSETNISFVVDRSLGVKAVRALHSKFRLDEAIGEEDEPLEA